jgi:hypothetical protein
LPKSDVPDEIMSTSGQSDRVFREIKEMIQGEVLYDDLNRTIYSSNGIGTTASGMIWLPVPAQVMLMPVPFSYRSRTAALPLQLFLSVMCNALCCW